MSMRGIPLSNLKWAIASKRGTDQPSLRVDLPSSTVSKYRAQIRLTLLMDMSLARGLTARSSLTGTYRVATIE